MAVRAEISGRASGLRSRGGSRRQIAGKLPCKESWMLVEWGLAIRYRRAFG